MIPTSQLLSHKKIQDGMHLLHQMKTPATQEEVIRNFLYSLSKHADYHCSIRECKKHCKECATKNQIVVVTWKKFKTHFIKYCTELE